MTHEPAADPAGLRPACTTGWPTGRVAKEAVAGTEPRLNVYRCPRCKRWHSTISETVWHAQVVKLIRTFGWRHAHFRPLMTTRGWRTPVSGDGKGFPDLLLTKGERLVVAELKTDDEATSVVAIEQQAWLDAFARVGAEAYVWRPRDSVDVARVLTNRPVRLRTLA